MIHYRYLMLDVYRAVHVHGAPVLLSSGDEVRGGEGGAPERRDVFFGDATISEMCLSSRIAGNFLPQ